MKYLVTYREVVCNEWYEEVEVDFPLDEENWQEHIGNGEREWQKEVGEYEHELVSIVNIKEKDNASSK